MITRSDIKMRPYNEHVHMSIKSTTFSRITGTDMCDLHHSQCSKLIIIITGHSAASEANDSCRPDSDRVMIWVLNWSLELVQCNVSFHVDDIFVNIRRMWQAHSVYVIAKNYLAFGPKK